MPPRLRPTADPLLQAPLPAPLRALARHGERCQWRARVQILSEGEGGDSLYIVLAGALRSVSLAGDGREFVHAQHGPGDCVGLVALDGGPRLCSVQTVAATHGVRVNMATLRQRLAEDPELVLLLLQRLAAQARQATLHLREMVFSDVCGRLCRLLDDLAQRQGDGRRVVDPAPSHLEMSRRLGCSREMVSRVLKDLEAQGWLQRGRRRLVVLQPGPGADG